jgi:hypothetical protein
MPHAVLLLSGFQGSGKSCAARVLVPLVDSPAAPLRSEPRDLEQWQVAASGSWAVATDNLSQISTWLSDAICKAATGDGLVKRKLYTDGELAVLAFRRAVLLHPLTPARFAATQATDASGADTGATLLGGRESDGPYRDG